MAHLPFCGLSPSFTAASPLGGPGLPGAAFASGKFNANMYLGTSWVGVGGQNRQKIV